MPGLLSFVFVFVSPPNLCVKELSVRIVKEFREHLVNELSQKAATVAQSQAEKRLELNRRMKAMVCERVDDISRKVPCLLHSAISFGVDRDDDGIIQHSCWKDIIRHFLVSGTRGCGHRVVVFHWMTTVCRYTYYVRHAHGRKVSHVTNPTVHRWTHPTLHWTQAENPAGANGVIVGGERSQLVSSSFEILDRDIQKLVTVQEGKVNEALLAELTWAVSREVFENLCEGEPK